MSTFQDARLEAPELVDDEGLRWLASAGARVRAMALAEPLGELHHGDRPRGVLLLGAEARLVRAVLEPVCPVPVMAWHGPTLPAWLGPLDLCVLIDDGDPEGPMRSLGAEAARRGARLLVAADERSALADVTTSSGTTLIPTAGCDPTAAAVALLALLGQLGLGPRTTIEGVADAVDLVAEDCSPMRDLSVNPGKQLALELADHVPLIWGGSTLAGRVARRLAEAVRRTCGAPALAADGENLVAVLRAVERRDPFADPDTHRRDPFVLLLDIDELPPAGRPLVEAVERFADAAGVRVTRIDSGTGEYSLAPVERYVTLLARGLYGVEYLRIGLGQ